MGCGLSQMSNNFVTTHWTVEPTLAPHFDVDVADSRIEHGSSEIVAEQQCKHDTGSVYIGAY